MVFTRLAGQSDSDTPIGSATNGAYLSVKFTPTSNLTVTTIRINRTSAQSQSVVVGIASSIGANPSGIVYLVQNSNVNVNTTGIITVFIPQITLNSGTAYYLIIGTPVGDGYQYASSGSAGETFTAIGSVTRQFSAGIQPVSWASSASTYIPFFDLGTDTSWVDPSVGGGGAVASKSIMDAILAAKRTAQGAPANTRSIDDVNYYALKAGGPDNTHKTINDLWATAWGVTVQKTINDRMYTQFGGSAATFAAHKSVADLIAAQYHAAGYP